MSSITITRVLKCESGNHVTLRVTGDTEYTWNTTVAEMMSPISDEEKEVFLKVLFRLAKIGRTNNQVRNALTNGYTITI